MLSANSTVAFNCEELFIIVLSVMQQIQTLFVQADVRVLYHCHMSHIFIGRKENKHYATCDLDKPTSVWSSSISLVLIWFPLITISNFSQSWIDDCWFSIIYV